MRPAFVAIVEATAFNAKHLGEIWRNLKPGRLKKAAKVYRDAPRTQGNIIRGLMGKSI